MNQICCRHVVDVTRGVGCWGELLPCPMKVAVVSLLRLVRVGARAELLPQGSLLVASVAIVVAAAGAAVALLFEADAVFLFKIDVLTLDIMGEARGSYWRTRARAAETARHGMAGRNSEAEIFGGRFGVQ